MLQSFTTLIPDLDAISTHNGIGKPSMFGDFFVMNKHFIDITGHVYGKLTVIEFLGRKNLHSYFQCKCECGNYYTATSNGLRSGKTRSCGCDSRQRTTDAITKHNESRKGKRTAEYETWAGMKARCYNPQSTSYKNYGAKGIIVCDRWLNSFENFLSDMGRRPSPDYSIDRYPNKIGNYEPSNCRWATDEQQQQNRTDNTILSYNGVEMILSEWARKIGIHGAALCYHIKKRGVEGMFLYYKNKGRI